MVTDKVRKTFDKTFGTKILKDVISRIEKINYIPEPKPSVEIAPTIEEPNKVDLKYSNKYGWIDVEYFRRARMYGMPTKKAVTVDGKECYNYASFSPEELVEEFLKEFDIGEFI